MTAVSEASLDLDPSPRAATRARQFLRTQLAGVIDDQAIIDLMVLAANELVTNAIIHAQTPFTLSVLQPQPDLIRIQVRDRDPRLPQPRPVSAEATSGRGMTMIQNLGLSWGTETLDTGKTVWIQTST